MTASSGPLNWRNLALVLSALVTGDWSAFQHDHSSAAQGGTVTGAPPTGAAGGDLSGSTYPSPTVAARAITFAKIQNVPTGEVWYRKTAGAGSPETQTLATIKTDLGLTGTNSGDQTITLTGDVTGSGTGSFAATVAIAQTTAAASKIPKSGSNAKIDAAWVPTSGSHDRRHFGSTNYDSWYIAGCTAGVGLTTAAVLANRIYARSFTTPSDSAPTIDRLGIEVTTLSAGSCRLGIYTFNNGYPDQLVIDAGTVSTSAVAVVSATISQALAPGTRYFLAAVFDATPTLRAITVNQADPDLGFPATIGTAMQTGFHSALTFGALPGTFPATPTMLTGVPFPALTRRYSA